MRTHVQRAGLQLGLQAITFASGWVIAVFLYAAIAVAWIVRKASNRDQARRFFSPSSGSASRSCSNGLAASANTAKSQSTEGKRHHVAVVEADAFSIQASACGSIFDVVPMVLKVDPAAGHSSETWRLVAPYLQQYGSGSLVSSTLFNPEFSHFFLPGIGSLVFCETDDYFRRVVVGVFDPITDPKHWEYITRMFLQSYPGAVFMHVTAPYGQLLAGMGYYVNDLGGEIRIQVQSWRYSKKTGSIRRAARCARDSGVSVRELSNADLTPLLRQQLQSSISGDWLVRKAVGDRLLRIFVRAVDYQQFSLDEGVRLFLAEADAPPQAAAAAAAAAVGSGSGGDALQHHHHHHHHQQQQQQQQQQQGTPQPETSRGGEATPAANAAAPAPADPGQAGSAAAAAAMGGLAVAGKVPVGFVLLDPIFRDGDVVGYTNAICRMSDTAHQGTLKLLYEEILGALRQEGAQQLNFGWAPLFATRDAAFDPAVHSTWVRWLCLIMYWCCNRLYTFRNLAFSKSRYGGGLVGHDTFKDPNVQLEHVFLAHKHTLPFLGLLDLYVLLKYVGIVGPVADTWLKMVGLRKGACSHQVHA